MFTVLKKNSIFLIISKSAFGFKFQNNKFIYNFNLHSKPLSVSLLFNSGNQPELSILGNREKLDDKLSSIVKTIKLTEKCAEVI